MQLLQTKYISLTHQSPEFDAAYDVISRDIAPEFLETREFLKNRLRVRDEEPKSAEEKILAQDGYTLHLIAAKQKDKVVGVIYGHLISKIGAENRGIAFVTYIAVLSTNRRQGVGSGLIEELKNRVNQDSLRITGHPIIGMVFEIEEEGKEEIKGLVHTHHAWPLDVDYFQPALRSGYEPEQMNLWYQSCEPEITSEAAASAFKMPAELAMAIVRNMLVMEYVGPETKGFDLPSKPYTEFIRSIRTRREISFKLDKV